MTNRSRAWRIAIALLVVPLSILFAVRLLAGWKIATDDGVSCHILLRPPPPFPYLQLNLKQQHPVEAYFDAGLFMNLADKHGTSPLRFTVVRSAVRAYGQSEVVAVLQWDERNRSLWMAKEVDITLVPVSGSHRFFPFDSATVDFTLSVLPSPDTRAILLRNSLTGFYLPCDTVLASEPTPGIYRLHFSAYRNPLTQLTAVVLLTAAVFFMVAIVGFVPAASLPTAVASYFFSLWSMRAIFGPEIKTFPTMLDAAILTIGALMLVMLVWRVLLANVNLTLEDMRTVTARIGALIKSKGRR